MNNDDLVVARAMDKLKLAEKTNKVTNTNMLDELEFSKISTSLKNIEFVAFGGYEMAERKCVVFGADDINFDEILSVVRIESGNELSHRSVLGSVLGLGIKREMIGDILISDNACDVIVMKEIANFIVQNLVRVGRDKVSASIKTLAELLPIKDNSKLMTITVASSRIDAVISACFGFSREMSTECINREKVFLNHSVVTSSSKQVKLDDTISVRGYGRVKIKEFTGETRKARTRIVVCKY